MYDDIKEVLRFFHDKRQLKFSYLFQHANLNLSLKDEEILKSYLLSAKIVQKVYTAGTEFDDYQLTRHGRHLYIQIETFEHLDKILQYLADNPKSNNNIVDICRILRIGFPQQYNIDRLLADNMIEKANSEDNNVYVITIPGRNFIEVKGGYNQTLRVSFDEQFRAFKKEKWEAQKQIVRNDGATLKGKNMPNKYDRAVQRLQAIKSPYNPLEGYEPLREKAKNVVEIYGGEEYKKRFNTMVTFNHKGDIRGDEEKHRLVTVAIDNAIHFYENKSEMEEDGLTRSVLPFDSQQVFIVHGRNGEIKESVARLITQLGLKPIILHEQVNSGKTLIEKFEHHSNVGFAIVLLTDDDLGKAKDAADLNKRARQNVVFEMGFFFGKLNRSRVVTLYAKDIELPSDLNGLVYIELDSAGAWKLKMAKELKQAGYNVDFSKI